MRRKISILFVYPERTLGEIWNILKSENSGLLDNGNLSENLFVIVKSNQLIQLSKSNTVKLRIFQ